MNKKNTSCPQCGLISSLAFRTKDYNRKVSRSEFNYFRCADCNSISLKPIPDNLKNYYPEKYYEIPSSVEELASGVHVERYKIDLLKLFITRGRILEIGPATGGFLYLAKEAGFEVQAIEMDARCCRFIRDKLMTSVLETDDAIAGMREALPCDVIALWHVIEHLPDPWPTLEAACKKLNPNGFLVVAAPNPEAFQFKLLKRYWAHVDAPRHLSLIPLNFLLEKVSGFGMDLCLGTTKDSGSLAWNLFGWQYSLSNLSSHVLMKKALRKFGRIVGKLLYPLESREGLGSTYTAIFQKK